MNKGLKTLASVFLIASTAIGCSSFSQKVEDITIEKVSSSLAHFDQATVTYNASGIRLAGVLHKRFHARTRIPGHVHIVVISSEGKLLHSLETNYRRESIKSRQSTFRVSLPGHLPKGSTVRFIHHTPWQEDLFDERSNTHQILLTKTNLQEEYRAG